MPDSEETPRTRRPNLQAFYDSFAAPVEERAKTFENAIGMKFVLVPAGRYLRGSPEAEPRRRDNEGPRREVWISKPFYLGVHPVTQRQFTQVMGRNPARFDAKHGGGPNHPVEMVSWLEVIEFCRKLSAWPEDRAGGRVYRLPTEAEWEYACRAGSDAAYSCGDTLSKGLGWWADAISSPETTAPVDRFDPNAFGLVAMHGLVWEWCSDWYAAAAYADERIRDPEGPPEGRYRLLRGGSWRNAPDKCRSSYRNALEPHHKDSATGFRIAFTAEGG